jgi:hypothetical protein
MEQKKTWIQSHHWFLGEVINLPKPNNMLGNKNKGDKILAYNFIT